MRKPQAVSNQNGYCTPQNHLHKGSVQCLWNYTEPILMD